MKKVIFLLIVTLLYLGIILAAYNLARILLFFDVPEILIYILCGIFGSFAGFIVYEYIQYFLNKPKF